MEQHSDGLLRPSRSRMSYMNTSNFNLAGAGAGGRGLDGPLAWAAAAGNGYQQQQQQQNNHVRYHNGHQLQPFHHHPSPQYQQQQSQQQQYPHQSQQQPHHHQQQPPPAQQQQAKPIEPLFEKYEIVGKGAYGAVYRGEEKHTGLVVALKVRGGEKTPACLPRSTNMGLIPYMHTRAGH
jgi:hypothetical protein